jgi:alcohol dehydrogenase (cytochrome c)
MYVTYANECFALDAGSGRQIWHYQRPRTKGITGVAAKGANRGAAVAGDRVFMATDNAHLIALDRTTGHLIWDTAMSDWHQNYNATSAPLAIGTMVVSGIAAEMTGRAALWSPTSRPAVRSYGASGRSRNGANRARKPGRDQRSTMQAEQPG